ncbi:MAG: hypothetical protein AVDCRST_MAG18-3275, partial [uncultured Thermomicrobiales bacterium]
WRRNQRRTINLSKLSAHFSFSRSSLRPSASPRLCG